MSGTQRFTLAWPIRSWTCLSNSQHGQRASHPPYTPLSDTVPPRRRMLNAEYNAAIRSMPAVFIMGSATASGSSPTSLWMAFMLGRAVGLHAHGVDDGVRATCAGHLSDVVTEVALPDAVEVSGLGPGVGHPRCGQAEYLRVPHADCGPIKVPEGPADDRFLYLCDHEPMGIVEEVGPGVTDLRPGDRVVIPFQIACGSCFMYAQRCRPPS
jgi:hypothetical protein